MILFSITLYSQFYSYILRNVAVMLKEMYDIDQTISNDSDYTSNIYSMLNEAMMK